MFWRRSLAGYTREICLWTPRGLLLSVWAPRCARAVLPTDTDTLQGSCMHTSRPTSATLPMKAVQTFAHHQRGRADALLSRGRVCT